MFDGKQLEKLIEKSGYSKGEFTVRLSSALGGLPVQQATVSRWLANKQKPRANTIRAISHVLNIDVSQLFHDLTIPTEIRSDFSEPADTERVRLNALAIKLFRRLIEADNQGFTIRILRDGEAVEPVTLLRQICGGIKPTVIQLIKDDRITQLEVLL